MVIRSEIEVCKHATQGGHVCLAFLTQVLTVYAFAKTRMGLACVGGGVEALIVVPVMVGALLVIGTCQRAPPLGQTICGFVALNQTLIDEIRKRLRPIFQKDPVPFPPLFERHSIARLGFKLGSLEGRENLDFGFTQVHRGS